MDFESGRLLLIIRGHVTFGSGVYGALVVKSIALSVPAVTTGRVDHLQLLEIEAGDGLQLVGQSRSFQVVRQAGEPGAVFVL